MWWLLALGVMAAFGSAGFVLYRARRRVCDRSYGEHAFVKVKYLALAEPIRTQFMTHTPALVKLGFELIGDYQIKPEPSAIHERIFLGREGENLATISATGGVSFISVLEDGTCVHTTSVKNPHREDTAEPNDQLWITFMSNTSIPELHRQHVNAVKGLCASSGNKALRLRKDQFGAALVYDQRAVGRWRFRHKHLDQKPPTPDIRRFLGEPLVTEGSDRALVGS